MQIRAGREPMGLTVDDLPLPKNDSDIPAPPWALSSQTKKVFTERYRGFVFPTGVVKPPSPLDYFGLKVHTLTHYL